MNSSELVAFFRKNSWFRNLPESVIAEIVVLSKRKTLAKGQLLHAKNDPPDGFFCVVSGKIRISNVNQDGKEMVLTWLEAGSWFGEISLFDNLPRTHDAHAECDTELVKLPTQAFHELLQRHPELYPHFMVLLCQKIRATFSLIDETGGLSLQGQLAKRLLLLSNGLGQSSTESATRQIEISQESLAHMLNSSRQTVNKLLQGMQRAGVLTVHYGKIAILDAQSLHRMSEI
jgi:CRP/FNR family cyclic AMP-dependent transcriptional regulator